MDKKELLKVVGELGFPLMETVEYDFEKVLREVVASRDVRLWEGFPVLLKNAFEMEKVNVEALCVYVNEDHNGYFWHLFCMAVALYQEFSLPHVFCEETQSREDFKRQVRKWRNAFVHGGNVDAGDVELSSDRVKRLFQDYYLSAQAEKLQKKRVAQEEVSLEYALSQVFSTKQKELFRKKLDGKLLTKTEREYYSRVVKKKVLALANEELYRLACLVRES